MADILKAYTALSASSSRSDVAKVLNSVINGSSTFYDSITDKLKQPAAPPFSFDTSSRTELIKYVLDDLKSCGTKGRLTLNGNFLYILFCC
jgi:hypothetical protein